MHICYLFVKLSDLDGLEVRLKVRSKNSYLMFNINFAMITG